MDRFVCLTPVLQGLLAGLFTWAVTALGAMTAVLFKRENEKTLNVIIGLGAGIMLAACFWSLLLPAVESETARGALPYLIPSVGFICGGGFMLLSDMILDRFSSLSESKSSTLLTAAITLHNFPEGMAVGVAFGAAAAANESIAGALAVTLGIALQNFPEGAAISLPLIGQGVSRKKAILFGQLSGIVEPIGAVIGAALASRVTVALSFLLAFAAGAMIYVAVKELIPEIAEKYRNAACLALLLGFTLMTVMDVALG